MADPCGRGWCLGSAAFKQEMIERLDGKLGEHHSGELRRESAEQKSERLVAEEMTSLGWKEKDLADRRKSDPAELALAARLRRETTLPIKWIAARLQIGTLKGARAVLHQLMQQHKQSK